MTFNGEPIEFAKMEAEEKKITEEETAEDSDKEKKDEKETEEQPMSREQAFNWRGKSAD